MGINWKVRAKNKAFWIAVIPATLLLLQAVAAVFGIVVNFAEISDKLLAVVNSAFVVLTILGIVTDPTTSGLTDSTQAMAYDKPKEK